MSNRYGIGDVVYLREPAALGQLEAVKISGVQLVSAGWVYTISVRNGPPDGALGDRRSGIGHQILYFSEDEFLSLHDALVLIEANALAAYNRAVAQRQAMFPGTS